MYKAIKIPFSTKKNNTNQIEGDAYYLFNNDKKIIKQFIQLKSGNYRPTDIEMLNTNYYKKNDEYILLRKKYLEKINPLDIHMSNKIRKELSKDEINLINKDLLKLSYIKKSLSIFKGSNPSGSENMPGKSEIKYYSDNYDWCNGINFSNPLNNLLIKPYKNICKDIVINNLQDDIEFYNFIDIIENDDFKEIYMEIEKYNFAIFYLKNKSINDVIEGDAKLVTDLIVGIKNEKKILNPRINNRKYNINLVQETVKDLEAKIINSDQCEKILRAHQKRAIKEEIDELVKNGLINSYNFLENDDIANLIPEHAHIISVKSCKQENKYKNIGDSNNCLILSPSIHTLFDNNLITFHDDGAMISENYETKNLNIKNAFLNNDRKKFLKENFSYYQKNKTNK